MAQVPNGKAEYDQLGLFDIPEGEYPATTTVSGYFDGTASTVDINDIAYALSSIRRYGGHARPRMNVAQHELIVAALAREPYEGLHHDSHEAYVIDMPKPLKVAMPDYQAIEDRAAKPVREYLGIPQEVSEDTKLADVSALFWEARWLIHNRGENWNMRDKFFKPWMDEWPLIVLSDDMSERYFLQAHNVLRNYKPHQRELWVTNTLRPLLGIPKDVDIYAEE